MNNLLPVDFMLRDIKLPSSKLCKPGESEVKFIETPGSATPHPLRHRTDIMQGLFESLNREAHRLVLEGARPADVDNLVQISKLNMGILASNDHYGIDVFFWERIKNRKTQTNDLDYFALGKELFILGRYGKKSGRGFYLYESSSKQPDPELSLIAAILAHATNINSRPLITEQEILERLLITLIIEGVKLTQEVPDVSFQDVDLVFSQEFNLPLQHKTPMRSATLLGSEFILDKIDHYQHTLGNHGEQWFACPPLLKKLINSSSAT
jgi:3-hydroxyacyl-CoA dehydrogenase